MIIWNEEHTQQLDIDSLDLTNGTVYRDTNGDFIYHQYTQEELYSINENRINTEIGNRQVELQATDYVVIKIYEAYIKNQDIESLKSEYADILTRRQQLRDEINQLQEQIKNLQ